MTLRTRIKICGLTREADVDAAVEAGADAVGFVLYDKSPRHVSLARAVALAHRLPPFVTPVGLFVNASDAEVDAAISAIPQLLLQFHGDESPQICDRRGRPYLRAARVGAD
ncbi:MAG TPA: N-(5'-phosphoribosyl)anthranilate isomerase, partial [Burkholderiaceae bacterium]